MEFSQYLAGAPADEFFWWVTVPAAIAVAGFIGSFWFVHRSRVIEDTPTSRLRSAAQGYVEVEGIARLMDGPPIVCPLTGTRCVWWRYRVERKETTTDLRGRRRTEWVTVEAGVSTDSFLLDDGTGTCVVNPDGAQVIPAQRHRWYGRSPRPDVGWAAGRGWWRASFCNYRYTEELIFAASAVYGLGRFRTQTGAADAFDERRDLTELLQKWKHDKRMMAMLDVNKDGSVDQKEWEAARRMAQRQVQREHVVRAVQTPDLHLLEKPRDRRPFILSAIPQAALVRRFRWSAVGCLAALGVGFVFATWVLVVRGVL